MSVTTAEQNIDLGKKPFFVWNKGKKSKPELVAQAMRSLAMLLRIGEGEATSLEIIGEQFKKYEVGKAFIDASDLMNTRGATFKQALMEQDVLPRVAKQMIDAATNSSQLHENISKAARLVGESVSVRKKIMNQLIQPAFMLGLAMVFMFIAVFFIIPGFDSIFSQLGAETPMMTVVLLQVADVLKWVISGAILVVVLGAAYWLLIGRRSPRVRAAVDRFMLKVPAVGPILQLSATGRMFDLLATSLESGQDEAEALRSAVRGCGNDAIREHGEDHAVAMINGEVNLKQVMDSKLFPYAASRMVLSSPTVIQQIQIMRELSAEYDQETKVQLDKLSKTLEPTVNYLVYGLVGVLVVIVILPMYSIYPAMMDMGGGVGPGTSTTPMPMP